MELKEFIKETLTQIIQGVEEAQSELKKSSAEISPSFSTRQLGMLDKNNVLVTSGGDILRSVDFDVAVLAIEGTGTKAGIGVLTGAFNLGTSGQSNQENQSSSRVKFSVPITLPISNK